MQPLFYSHVKSEEDELPRYKTYWNLYNLIQGCQWKELFVMFKGKFRSLLSRVNIPLHHMPNLDIFAQHVHC